MKKGFTLIELLVVVLIIGILSAIALPQYTKAVEKARLAEAFAMLKSLETATGVWVLENGLPSSGQVDFLGNSASGKGQLSIDLPGDFNCSVESGKACLGKNFQYSAYCNSSGCGLAAERMEQGERIYDFGKYSLYNNSGVAVVKYCYYYSAIGEQISSTLTSQGYGECADMI